MITPLRGVASTLVSDGRTGEHGPVTGIRVLVDKKMLPREPNYLLVSPVGNDDVAAALLASLTDHDERKRIQALPDRTSALKRIAIRQAVEAGLEKYGAEPEHRFGMSDDDPQNVDLIIKGQKDPIFDGVNFKAEAGWKDVDPASGTLVVRPDNKTTPLASLENQQLEAGKSYTFVVVGKPGEYEIVKVEDVVAK